nr:hypothetical protein [Lacticaseibacillus sharpeae]
MAKALRDEGTSFHYLPAAADIVLNAEFAAQIKQSLTAAHIPVRAVQTWTNDAFFRETPAKIAAALAAGYTVWKWSVPPWLRAPNFGARCSASCCLRATHWPMWLRMMPATLGKNHTWRP